MRVHIIRTSGAEEHIDADWESIAVHIGAEVMDSVSLRDGRRMFVNDAGWDVVAVETSMGTDLVPIAPRLPVNEKATALYLRVCKPGTTHRIVGDVAIVEDDPF